MLLAEVALVNLLIWLLLLAIVIYVVFLIVGMLPIPERLKMIVTLIIGIIFLVVLLQKIGML